MKSSSYPVNSVRQASLVHLFPPVQTDQPGNAGPATRYLSNAAATYRSLLCSGAAARTIHNPFQYPHIPAETRPDEVTIRVFPEPVHKEDPRRYAHLTL